MNKEKRSVPKLRFPGFTEDWEQRKFLDLLDAQNGIRRGPFGSSLKKDSFVKKSDYVVYEQQNAIYDNYETRYFISKEKYNELIRFNIQPGDFIMSGAGTIGRISMVPDGIKKGVFNQALIRFKVNKDSINPLYFLKFMQSDMMQKQLTQANPGSAMTNLVPMDELKKWDVIIPSLEEQNRISTFINQMDAFITLHQRKLEHLKLKKKALLQKLFPKNGERYPELRFPGFTDAWEQRKLGSIGSTYTGLSGKTKEDFGHGEAKYITYLNVFQNTISNITMTDKVEIDPTQNEVKYGDVLFTTSSETPEEVGMSSVWLGDTPNIYLNSFCFGFRPNQKIDSYFLGYSLRAPYMRDKIKILAQGISRYNISKNKVMELEISLPNNEEQKLLGTFLQRIDLIITLHQRKLGHLQLQKKALLQQMFV